MYALTTDNTDDFTMNVELAKTLAGKGQELHIFKGTLGDYRVRVNTKDGKWKMVNFRNPHLNREVERAFGIEVVKEGDMFRAKSPKVRVGTLSPDRLLAVAGAALKAGQPAMPLAL